VHVTCGRVVIRVIVLCILLVFSYVIMLLLINARTRNIQNYSLYVINSKSILRALDTSNIYFLATKNLEGVLHEKLGFWNYFIYVNFPSFCVP
jgi:hypothetical protein